MKYFFFTLVIPITILFSACNNGNNQYSLSAKAFAEKINTEPNGNIIDVRTADEFANGHLQNAKNIDWTDDHFATEIESISKTTPVFIYCLSGGRSSSAAKFMRSKGFKDVYELDGGMMKWRAANLPETTQSTKAITLGMSKQQFDSLIHLSPVVLIDVYAEWCAPCKKMKPFIEEISNERKDQLTVIRIDADNNVQLCKELKIDALPTLLLYKNQTLTWTNTGFIDKAGILKNLQ